MPIISPVPDDDGLADAYAYPDGRTWIRANFVSTVDGAVTGVDGRSGSIAPRVDTRVFALLRSLADVILVGAGTARQEGYETVRPDEVDAGLRESLGLAPVPPIAVVTASLEVPDALVAGTTEAPRTIVITTRSAPRERLARLREHCDVVVSGTHTVELGEVRSAMSERGLHRVVCEGGPSLLGGLVEADAIDEMCLTVAPKLVVGNAPRVSHGGLGVDLPLRLGHLLYEDDVLMARYVRDRSST